NPIFHQEARKRGVHKRDENHFSWKTRKNSVHKQDEPHSSDKQRKSLHFSLSIKNLKKKLS
ncbi:hypothetical protein, partial [Niallia sp.]|uniref:hypothetical protein n=1 Tax=Niallia sp. TaxID=2837523 RepID=UPI0028A2BD3C